MPCSGHAHQCQAQQSLQPLITIQGELSVSGVIPATLGVTISTLSRKSLGMGSPGC